MLKFWIYVVVVAVGAVGVALGPDRANPIVSWMLLVLGVLLMGFFALVRTSSVPDPLDWEGGEDEDGSGGWDEALCATDRAPRGWYCSREAGHEGPCAAWPVSHETAATMPELYR